MVAEGEAGGGLGVDDPEERRLGEARQGDVQGVAGGVVEEGHEAGDGIGGARPADGESAAQRGERWIGGHEGRGAVARVEEPARDAQEQVKVKRVIQIGFSKKKRGQ